MKEKFKRYLVIIPAVFVLLLSCVPMLGAHATDNYPDYWHDVSELEDKGYEYDIEDIQHRCQEYWSSNFSKSDTYFCYVYNPALTSNRNKLYIVYVPIREKCYEDDTFLCYQTWSEFIITYDISESSITYSNITYGTNSKMLYHKPSGRVFLNTSNNLHSLNFDQGDYRYDIYCEDTNIEDFPFPEGINTPNANKPNVSVRIEPDLTGSIDTRTMWDGSKQDNAIIRYYVVNNGRQNVAYSFYIVDRGFDVLSVVNSNPFCERISNSVKFVHLSEEFQTALTSGTSYTLAKGRSRWRIQRSQSNGGKFIAWAQMNLLKNTQYDVVVLAYTTPLTYIDVYDQSLCGQIHEVYRSSFTLTRDSGYDPANNSFGNSAYKPGDSLAAHSFSQYYDQDGNLQVGNFTREDIQENANPDNYVYNGNHGGSGGYRPGDVGTSGGYYDSDGNFVSSSFNSLSYSISGFLSFFNGVWSYIPGNYTALIGLSITALVVVAIFKGVFR